jgi:hypothetical protein
MDTSYLFIFAAPDEKIQGMMMGNYRPFIQT